MHINEETLQKFLDGTLPPDKLLQTLEHLDTCEYCREALAALEADTGEVQAPAYLKQQIQERVRRPDVQTALQVKKTTKQLQLFYYSMKTAAGVIGALLILLAVSKADLLPTVTYREPPSVTTQIPERIYEKGNQVTDWLKDITNKLVNGGN
jgi:anti-sigma factor RsiW